MRHDGDDWDIKTSVGATALLVAAGRAFASEEDNPLINDPYARDFVREADYKEFDLTSKESANKYVPGSFDWLVVYMAIRTKIIDDAIGEALAAGVRQLVILAAGLDARPYRLKVPDDLHTFEIDREQVLTFKHKVLAKAGATATGEHRVVVADLRDDWVAKLKAEGFDSSQPTIWIAEGLLPYLPGEARRSLAKTVTENSAPGSRWILDYMDNDMKSRWQQFQNNSEGEDSKSPLNIEDLIYLDEDSPASVDLVKDWQYRTETIEDNRKKFGVSFPEVSADATKKEKEIAEKTTKDMVDFGFLVADLPK